jgi:hypothetical protein
MTMASPVWDIVGNDGPDGDNGLSFEGLRPGEGGALLVLERWRREVVSVVRCPNATFWGCLCGAVSMSQSDPPFVSCFSLVSLCFA